MDEADFDDLNNGNFDDEAIEVNDSNKKKNDTSISVKKIVRNPQPKLNPERLSGDRGIPQLPKIFASVTFKGKDHEKEDLDTVMKVLEHWSYRLFPRFTFEDVLDRIERLGVKRPVQTCLKRIRLDMLDDDNVANENENKIDVNETDEFTEIQSHSDIFDGMLTSTLNETRHFLSTEHKNSTTQEQVGQINWNCDLARQKHVEEGAHQLSQVENQCTNIDAPSQFSNIINTDSSQLQNPSNEMLTEEELLSLLEDENL